jgi:hypothetical protein
MTMSTDRSESAATVGIFPYLVNRAVFVDKVVAAVWGTRRKRSIPRIVGERNFAIGGPKSFYARCKPRRHSVSDNDLQLKYGLMRKYGNLSPLKLTMIASGSPITSADLSLTLDGLLHQGYRSLISLVELTFDTEGVSLDRFGRELCSRAQIREFQNGRGKVSLYVGGPRSPWQLRIYNKTPWIVRLEFVLRNVYLRAHHIRRPQDVLFLRKTDLGRLVGFREVSQAGGYALPARIREPWLERGLTLPPAVPASIVQKELRQAGVNPARWVVPSKREALLREMQNHMVW